MATLTINNSICNISYVTVEYGLLYNWWAAIGDTDGDGASETSIAAEGWGLPTISNWTTLLEYIGGTGPSQYNGYKLKESGTTYWDADNGTNELSMNIRGAGFREYDSGGFSSSLKTIAEFWSSTPYVTDRAETVQFSSATTYAAKTFDYRPQGNPIVLLKDSPTASELALADGANADPYIGNDGSVYYTVKIGTQVWLAQSLVETKYRDGTVIPEETDNTNWSNLTTGALCAYNNDWANAGISKPAYY